MTRKASIAIAVFVVGLGLRVSTQARSDTADQARNSQQSRQADDHPRFPAGDGRDVTLRVCSQCHSPDSAADQQLDAAGWQNLVTQMVETGAEMTPQEFDQIVRYLTKAFPPRK